MKRLFRTVASDLVVLRLTLAMVSFLALGNSGCWSPCDNELVSTRPSPDGRMNAVVFVRSCGATTPAVTELSLLPANVALPPRGWANALTLSDDPEHPVQRSAEAMELQLKWNSNNRLIVSFPRAAVADKRATNVDGVGIQYKVF